MTQISSISEALMPCERQQIGHKTQCKRIHVSDIAQLLYVIYTHLGILSYKYLPSCRKNGHNYWTELYS